MKQAKRRTLIKAGMTSQADLCRRLLNLAGLIWFIPMTETGTLNAGKAPFSGEFRVLNAAGEYLWLLAHGVPRYSVDGSFVGYISACTDITENKLVEQRLQTALEQVRLSKEAAELGTFDMNLQNGDMHWDDR